MVKNLLLKKSVLRKVLKFYYNSFLVLLSFKKTSSKFFLPCLLIISVGILIIVKLFSLQVINSSSELINNNASVQKIYEFPERGYIYDRNGNLLVANQPAFDVMIVPKELAKIDTIELCKDLNITKKEFSLLDYNIRKKRSYSKHRPNIFMKNISAKTYASFQSHLYKYKVLYLLN